MKVDCSGCGNEIMLPGILYFYNDKSFCGKSCLVKHLREEGIVKLQVGKEIVSIKSKAVK